MDMDHVEQLNRLKACSAAVEYAQKFETLQSAWDNCKRADWMFWLIGRTSKSEPWSDERKPIVLCALECAETVKHLWPILQKERIEKAVDTIKKWCNGETETSEAQVARRELDSAAAAAAAYAVSAAAAAAAYAVSAAAAAAYAVSAAADAAAYAAAADAAAYAAAYVADAYAAAYAVSAAAADAADADAAAYAAAYAADAYAAAADAAAYAAAYAADAADGRKKQCADIVREYYPTAPQLQEVA